MSTLQMLKTNSIRKPDMLIGYRTRHLLGYMKILAQEMGQQVKALAMVLLAMVLLVPKV